MTESDRRQLIDDLTALCEAAGLALTDAEGERRQQLIDLLDRGRAALRELQPMAQRPDPTTNLPLLNPHKPQAPQGAPATNVASVEFRYS